MDRARFDALLAAYGAELGRWPEAERQAAAAFAAAYAEDLAAAVADARRLDAALDETREAEADTRLLAARILKAAPRPQSWALDRRALLALAACAVFGLVLGYGGGLLAPAPEEDFAYFDRAFEAPYGVEDEG